MRLSEKACGALTGIENANSIAMSCHKWLFQPKDSAVILFKDVNAAHQSISFGSGYLATPNIGVLGSSSARAGPLAATLIAWGRKGLAERIDRCLALADAAAVEIDNRPDLELFANPSCGVVAWRPRFGDVDAIAAAAPKGLVSTAHARDQRWLRFVAANPNAELERIVGFLTSLRL
jgi:L-2,4-diaminobutyrate decarboxylase